jgi:nucleoside-diphosphate-sugar epimerase
VPVFFSGSATVTGAGGFVGRALLACLGGSPRNLHLAKDDWREQVARADFRDATVFHLAARVHDERASRDAFMHDNVEKTRVLATAARAGGARRFVFLSTIKVNGEETFDRPYAASDLPQPQDDYGRSKWEAEQVIASLDGLSSVVVRSPLVYGPEAKGNLRSLLRLADTPYPLPLAGIRNRRSFIHVDDLARLLVECATVSGAVGQTILAAHRDPFSTPQIVGEMRQQFGRPARMFNIAPSTLEFAARAAGAGEKMRRMTRSLEVDSTGAERLLGWTAQVGLQAAIEQMVRAYKTT